MINDGRNLDGEGIVPDIVHRRYLRSRIRPPRAFNAVERSVRFPRGHYRNQFWITEPAASAVRDARHPRPVRVVRSRKRAMMIIGYGSFPVATSPLLTIAQQAAVAPHRRARSAAAERSDAQLSGQDVPRRQHASARSDRRRSTPRNTSLRALAARPKRRRSVRRDARARRTAPSFADRATTTSNADPHAPAGSSRQRSIRTMNRCATRPATCRPGSR